MTETAGDNAAGQPRQNVAGRAWRFTELLASWVAGRQSTMAIVAIVIFIGFSLAAPTFFTAQNLVLVVQQTAFIGIVAVGETFVFVAGELDLSVGSAYGLASILMAWLVTQQGLDPWVAAVIVLGYGVALGLFNGFVTVRIGVPSFIVTLGMLSLLRGLALFVSNNYPIQLPAEVESFFFTLTGGTVFGVSVQVLWFGGIAIVGAILLRSTTYGYHVAATGGNPVAAQEMGIDTGWIKISTFVLTSVLAAFVGVVQVGWLRNAAPTTGTGFELQAIGAVLIGGTALMGGEGGVFGTVIGAMILGMMSVGLVLMGLPPESTAIASGAIIVAAGSSDALIRKRSRTVRARRDREATEAVLDVNEPAAPQSD